MPTDPVAAEIAAEIADHLATAAETLQSQGVPTNEAREKSQAKFGDPETITRLCYWIKQGDALMFRTATIVLLTLLCVTLGLVAYGGYRSQRQMAEEMSALTKQLQILAERLQPPAVAPTPPTEPKPLEITGQVYIGSPDKPSPKTEVMICRANDGEIVRRVSTDDGGHYKSGPIAAGDYTAIVKGLRGAPSQGMGVQSEPIYLHPGAQNVVVSIDATYLGGDIAIELSQPLPRTEIPGKFTIASRLYVYGFSPQSQPTRWTTARNSPPMWPIYVYDPDTSPSKTVDPGERFRFIIGTDPRERGDESPPKIESCFFRVNPNLIGGVPSEAKRPLPAAPCWLWATIVSDILAHDFADAVKDNSGQNFRWMDEHYAHSMPPGAAWRAKLRNEHFVMSSSRSSFGSGELALRRLPHDPDELRGSGEVSVAIEDGKKTRVRVEIPGDIEAQIQKLVESVTTADEFVDRLSRDNPFFRDAPLTVLGTEPLVKAAEE